MAERDDGGELRARYGIIGGGPGGLQAAYLLQQAGCDYVLLERGDRAGTFFATYPRHRRLISINKRHNHFAEPEFNERHDWNSLLSDDPELRFTDRSDELFPHADAMCAYLEDFARRTDLVIRYGAEVVHVARSTGGFEVTTSTGTVLRCEVLLLATGAVRERRPDIEGIEHTTPYGEHSTDLERYRNKRVAILGQGNSAFETADHLAGVAAYVHVLGKQQINWAWDTHFPGHLRAVNNSIIDMFQLKSLHAVLAPRILRIERDGPVLRTTHEYDYPQGSVPGTLTLTRDYDEIICATGFEWVAPGIFDDEIRPETCADGKYPSLTPCWESTNIEGLFVVGGAMQGRDRRSASGFIHGFRYNVRTLCRLLEERYEGRRYPVTYDAPFEWTPFETWLMTRLSTTAALYQLFGTLCDVVVVDRDGTRLRVLEELPIDHVAQRDFGDAHVFTVSLEFGFDAYVDPAVTFMGPSDPTDPSGAAFLHPVLRHLGGTERTFRFADSLLGRWDLPHASGGAVSDRHEEFRTWFHECVGIGVAGRTEPAPNGSGSSGAGSYRPWTDQEVRAWQDQHRAEGAPGRRNPLSSADRRLQRGGV